MYIALGYIDDVRKHMMASPDSYGNSQEIGRGVEPEEADEFLEAYSEFKYMDVYMSMHPGLEKFVPQRFADRLLREFNPTTSAAESITLSDAPPSAEPPADDALGANPPEPPAALPTAQVLSLERVAVSSVSMTDASGNALERVTAGQKVQLGGTLTNGQDSSQRYVLFVQVSDAAGSTVHLAWTQSTLGARETAENSMSWTAAEPGEYTATVFVWESLDTPVALAPQSDVAFSVA
jgi:hypothetical protein